MSVQNDREYVFALYSSTDKSTNNLPLFLLDVNVYVLQTTKASF